MRVSIAGTGNVGAALLFPLVYNDAIQQIDIISRREESAIAAIMDVASANPQAARKMRYDAAADVSESDVVVITSGVNQRGKSAAETYGPNLEIAKSILQGKAIKSDAIIICIATPVDYMTVDVQRMTKLNPRQVFGFGGDLDTNRLRYVLASRGNESEHAHAVGEHGPNAIPVYDGEHDYDQVTKELREFWMRIARGSEVVRNLATADLLAKHVDSVVTDANRYHNVCAYDEKRALYFTWPTCIGRNGTGEPMQFKLGPKASQSFDSLLSERRSKIATDTAVKL